MSGIGVVVPNYNGAAVLPACLAALDSQTLRPDVIVVADNGSTDGSADQALRRWPDIVVRRSTKKLGFGGAANFGVEVVDSPFVAVLNSDARPASNWLESLAVHTSDDDTWAWGSVLLRDSGRIESAGDAYDMRGFAFKLFAGKDVSVLPTDRFDVFAPAGAAPLFRRDRFLELGGYEASFFMYYEDIDLAWRARWAGYKAVTVPTAHVHHLQSATTVTLGSGTLYRYVGRNSLLCAVRNVPTLTLPDLARAARRELRWAKGDHHALTWARGRVEALHQLPWALRTRAEIRRDRSAPVLPPLPTAGE